MTVRLGDVVSVDDRLFDNAADWYRDRELRVPAAFRDVPMIALRYAYRTAGRDWHRVSIGDDGSLIVHNQPVW